MQNDVIEPSNGLTDEEIGKLAAIGQYREKASVSIAANIRKKIGSVPSDELARYIKKLHNLTGPKTQEGKAKALKNLKQNQEKQEDQGKNITSIPKDHPVYSFLINDDEAKFYIAREEKYKTDYKMNDSSDQTTLQQIILEEISINRYRKRQAERDFAYENKQFKEYKEMMDFTNQIGECNKRINELIKLFGGDRRSRGSLKSDDKAGDLASLVLRFEDLTKRGIELEDIGSVDAEVDKFVSDSRDRREQELRELGL